MSKNKIKWNMNVRDIATIGMCIAIAVILGKGLGVLHKVMPFSRGVINAPFYSFLMALILYKTRKPGSMSLFALGYGIIMARISIISTISIIIGGVLMQIFISPELMKESVQVLNIINTQNKAVGYLSILIDEKKMYVYGHLEEEGVCEDYKDLVKPYLQGLTKIKPELEVMTYFAVGGKKIEIELDKE